MIPSSFPVNLERDLPPYEILKEPLVLLIDPDEMYRVQLAPEAAFDHKNMPASICIGNPDLARIRRLTAACGPSAGKTYESGEQTYPPER